MRKRTPAAVRDLGRPLLRLQEAGYWGPVDAVAEATQLERHLETRGGAVWLVVGGRLVGLPATPRGPMYRSAETTFLFAVDGPGQGGGFCLDIRLLPLAERITREQALARNPALVEDLDATEEVSRAA